MEVSHPPSRPPPERRRAASWNGSGWEVRAVVVVVVVGRRESRPLLSPCSGCLSTTASIYLRSTRHRPAIKTLINTLGLPSLVVPQHPPTMNYPPPPPP